MIGAMVRGSALSIAAPQRYRIGAVVSGSALSIAAPQRYRMGAVVRRPVKEILSYIERKS
jgi:hypothetical protein